MVSRGRSAAVSTFTTPSAARASAVSSSADPPARHPRPATSTACTIPGRAWSAEYRAAPVSLAGPSGRGSAMPIAHAIPPATRRRADRGPLRQLDLVGVAGQRTGVGERRRDRGPEPGGSLEIGAGQRLPRPRKPPRPVRHAAQRDARLVERPCRTAAPRPAADTTANS